MSITKTAFFLMMAILIPFLAGYVGQSLVWPLANILVLSAQNVGMGWRVGEESGPLKSFFAGIPVAGLFVLPSYFAGLYFG